MCLSLIHISGFLVSWSSQSLLTVRLLYTLLYSAVVVPASLPTCTSVSYTHLDVYKRQFDDREDAFDPYNAVIGAAEYSLITTRAVKRVIARRNRFLSLPLPMSCASS